MENGTKLLDFGKASRPDWPRGQNIGLGLGLEKLASASTSV